MKTIEASKAYSYQFSIKAVGVPIDIFTVYDTILAGGANTAKITVNVWDFSPFGTAITPLQRGGFPQRKSILKDICTEIQVITTVNEFLRFHTNPGLINTMQITMKLEAK